VGWEDADTELSESARRNRIIAEGGEEEFTETWGTLYDIGGDARVNGIPFDEHRTNDLRRETMSESEMQAELERLRAENAQLKSKDKGGLTLKGERERRGLSVQHGPFSGHAVQRTMAPHPGECAGDRGVHPRKRLQAENEGVEL